MTTKLLTFTIARQTNFHQITPYEVSKSVLEPKIKSFMFKIVFKTCLKRCVFYIVFENIVFVYFLN